MRSNLFDEVNNGVENRTCNSQSWHLSMPQETIDQPYKNKS